MIDRNGVWVGVAGALVALSGALAPVAAQDTKPMVRVATTSPSAVKPTARVAPAVADAAMQGDLAKVRVLLAQQSDVNVPQGDGMTALHWAAMVSVVSGTTSVSIGCRRHGASRSSCVRHCNMLACRHGGTISCKLQPA